MATPLRSDLFAPSSLPCSSSDTSPTFSLSSTGVLLRTENLISPLTSRNQRQDVKDEEVSCLLAWTNPPLESMCSTHVLCTFAHWFGGGRLFHWIRCCATNSHSIFRASIFWRPMPWPDALQVAHAYSFPHVGDAGRTHAKANWQCAFFFECVTASYILYS